MVLVRRARGATIAAMAAGGREAFLRTSRSENTLGGQRREGWDSTRSILRPPRFQCCSFNAGRTPCCPPSNRSILGRSPPIPGYRCRTTAGIPLEWTSRKPSIRQSLGSRPGRGNRWGMAMYHTRRNSAGSSPWPTMRGHRQFPKGPVKPVKEERPWWRMWDWTYQGKRRRIA